MQQNNINQQNKTEDILNEIEKLKKKMDATIQKLENPNKDEINKYWEHLKKEPDLITKISADLYKAPCLVKKQMNGEETTTKYKSPFELMQDTSLLLKKLSKINKDEAIQNEAARKKLGTELHDLGVMYHDLEKIYNKIQPRLDQIEAKLNSRLVNSTPIQNVIDEVLNKL